MSIYEIDAKVKELRELRNMEAVSVRQENHWGLN